jgi:carboxy-terminal domain RNA polymerase II polypeptide A small phosphatase
MYNNSISIKTSKNKLLILDLDETLIYSSETQLERPHHFTVDSFFVYGRPGLSDFLTKCSQIFNLAVWTASSPDYANQILEKILPDRIHLEFVFTQERCSFNFNHESGRNEIIKSLAKIKRKGYLLRDTIIVDDLPETFQKNYGNAILVSKYFGSLEDNELYLLFEYLNILGKEDDVRKIEKRNWRNRISN